MSKLIKYPTIGLTIVLLLLLDYSFYLKNQRDNAQHELKASHSQLAQLANTNQQQQITIDHMLQQAERERNYLQDLQTRRQHTEQSIAQLQLQFKKQQHENKPINDWASQPLPNGLYQPTTRDTNQTH